MEEFLNPFRTRASGVAKLSEPEFANDQDCVEYLQMVGNNRKYHSMDAAGPRSEILDHVSHHPSQSGG